MYIWHCGAPAGSTANSVRAATTGAAEEQRAFTSPISSCDNRGGGRTESIYQPYIDGEKEIREINEEYRAPFVRA